MAEGGAAAMENLETRLVNLLVNIFPHIDDRVIRESVYTVLVAANGENLVEEILLNRCIDGLILPMDVGYARPAPKAAAPKRTQVDPEHGAHRPRSLSTPDVDAAKRVRPNTTSESGESEAGRRSPLLDNDASVSSGANQSFADESMQIDDPEIQERVQRQQEIQTIADMFPWVQPQWISDQLDKPNHTKELVVEIIIDNPKVVPKKEKAKAENPVDGAGATAAAAASDGNGATAAGGTAAAGKTNTTAPSNKDYLNDYHNIHHPDQYTSSYLSSRFPWLYADGIRRVVNFYNGHFAPAFNVLYNATKDIDYSKLRGASVSVTVVRKGKPDATVCVKVLKGRRPSFGLVSLQNLPACVAEEVAWIESKFGIGNSSTASQNTSSVVGQTCASQLLNTSDVQRESELEMARLRGEIFECSICFGEYVISRDMVACADGHLFCAECLRQHAQQAIYGQAKTDLVCMNDDCDARFLHDMVLKALDPENVKKLDERRMFEALNSADIEGLEKCKVCNFSIIFDVPPDVNKVFQCGDPRCGKEFCRLCKVDWEEHIGKPCREVETDDDTRKRREAEERMAAAIIRRCHKCKTPLIKNEGCNKLTCSCGAIMCYICREAIKDYEHFCRHARDPGQPCTQCKNCYLWENPDTKDAVAVNEIQAEAKKAVAESGKTLKIGADEPAMVPNAANPGQNGNDVLQLQFQLAQMRRQQMENELRLMRQQQQAAGPNVPGRRNQNVAAPIVNAAPRIPPPPGFENEGRNVVAMAPWNAAAQRRPLLPDPMAQQFAVNPPVAQQLAPAQLFGPVPPQVDAVVQEVWDARHVQAQPQAVPPRRIQRPNDPQPVGNNPGGPRNQFAAPYNRFERAVAAPGGPPPPVGQDPNNFGRGLGLGARPRNYAAAQPQFRRGGGQQPVNAVVDQPGQIQDVHSQADQMRR